MQISAAIKKKRFVSIYRTTLRIAAQAGCTYPCFKGQQSLYKMS